MDGAPVLRGDANYVELLLFTDEFEEEVVLFIRLAHRVHSVGVFIPAFGNDAEVLGVVLLDARANEAVCEVDGVNEQDGLQGLVISDPLLLDEHELLVLRFNLIVHFQQIVEYNVVEREAN